jgi:DNA-binding transcriptional ArsR family regulator/intracellular sulfur oxidation DsrE/DsrF family protein
MYDNSLLTTERAEATARLLRALGNPQRLRILCRLLHDGELSAGVLAQRLGLSASALSPHLARMRSESLVTQRREGRTLYYQVNQHLDVRLPALLENICHETDDGDPAMNHLARAAAVVGLAFASTADFTGDGAFWQTTAIHDAGRIHALPDAAYQPDPDATYKVVFAMTRASEDPAKVNPSLQRLARTVNLYVNAGVPLKHLKFVAVASGPATAMALDDAHYRKLYGVANPNLKVIGELRADGIDVAVCGQAVAEHDYHYDWVDDHVTVALSALTTITELQQKGYALMPL